MHRETVFIVDDDASVRDSLSLLLSLRGHATAVFASGEDFLSTINPDWRGVLVVDIRMPGMSGLELQQRLMTQGVKLPVIVITAHGDVAAARQAFLAQAVDFIEKPFDPKQLISAIENAQKVVPDISHSQAHQISPKPNFEQLSPREREVLSLMTRGIHNRTIADELGISARTVEVHKARVMEKLGVKNIVDLVRLVDKIST